MRLKTGCPRSESGTGALFDWRSFRIAANLAVAIALGACSDTETIRVRESPKQLPAGQLAASQPVADQTAPGRAAADRNPAPPPAISLVRLDPQLAGQSGASPGTSLRAVPAAPSEKLKVALLLPLSGPRRRVGQDFLDAAQLAVFDLAAHELVLLPIDTEGTPVGAARASAEAASREARLILGPLLAESVSAAAAPARAAGLSVISFSNSAHVGGDGVFAFGFDPGQQIDAVVAHATAAGLSRFAVIAPDNAFGEIAIAAMRRATESRGAVLVGSLQLDPRTVDPSAEIKRFVGRRPPAGSTGEPPWPAFDAVLLAAGNQHLKTLASLLSYYDADYPQVRFLGLANWERTRDIEKELSLLKGWYAAPASGERRKFSERFQKVYGYSPVGIATLAYDGVALAAAFAGKAPASPELVQVGGFSGVDGLFRLDASGVAERAFEIREVAPGGFVVRRAAPTRFAKIN